MDDIKELFNVYDQVNHLMLEVGFDLPTIEFHRKLSTILYYADDIKSLMLLKAALENRKAIIDKEST